MKKIIVLISLVAFLGVMAAPVIASSSTVTVEMVKNLDKDDKKDDKKAEKKAEKKSKKADCKTNSDCCKSKKDSDKKE